MVGNWLITQKSQKKKDPFKYGSSIRGPRSLPENEIIQPEVSG